ncbi:MAG: thioredoxin family protein [Bacteroidia bacterium]
MTPIEIDKIVNPYSYIEYKELVIKLAEEKKCTGEQSPEKVNATALNAQRMKRIDKQIELNDDLKNVISSINKKYTWTLIVESWCGDGAQCVPVIAKISELNPNIELNLILRDENPSYMDNFLTNGARAIPKLIFEYNNKVIGTWGPRPKAIQKMVTEYKQNNPDVSHEDFVTILHLWYARDKTQSLQNELKTILSDF